MKTMTTAVSTLLAAAAIYAAPATAMTERPSEPGSLTGSSTSSGGATAVPEPGMIALFGMGALAIGLRARKRKSR